MSKLAAQRPMEIYSVAQVREIDRAAIDVHGIAGYELMTRAASAAFALLRRRWPSARHLQIWCGAGNNAGDGYVLARIAATAGLEVEVLAVTEPARLRGDAATAARDAERAGLEIRPFGAHPMAARAESGGVVVDALLGTGLDRPLSDHYAKAVEAINAAGLPVLALDVPSGLDADTGQVLGVAVRASVTITFVGQKPGLFLGVAPDYCGQVEYAGLEIPAAARASQRPVLERLTSAAIERLLPPRRRGAHKGSHGRVLLVGGGPGMGGAIRLAGEAALRAGAGLVNVATHPDHVAALVAGRPEIIGAGVLEPAALDLLIGVADVIVLGPGLGQTEWAKPLWHRVLASSTPLVVDADGLNLLAAEPCRRGNWIVTPHPGEAARLLECSVRAIEADRLGAARRIAAQLDAVTVLKGARTIVAGPQRDVPAAVCDAGNPGMATAGMGDVLAGLIGALVGQSGQLEAAARVGVLIHALAGDAAAAAGGERGLIASDVFLQIRHWANPQ